jgi:hypothetical protein
MNKRLCGQPPRRFYRHGGLALLFLKEASSEPVRKQEGFAYEPEEIMKTSSTASAKRLRAVVLGFILLLLVLLTFWVFVMIAANISPIYEAIGKRNGFNWWLLFYRK